MIDICNGIALNFPNASSLISSFPVSYEKILNNVKLLNPNKAQGWDGISVRMIKFSNTALITPLETVFTTCLKIELFPEIWYRFIKRIRKIYKKIIGQSLSCQFLGRSLRNSSGILYILISSSATISTQIGQSFVPIELSTYSTINQLISITHTIFEAFD